MDENEGIGEEGVKRRKMGRSYEKKGRIMKKGRRKRKEKGRGYREHGIEEEEEEEKGRRRRRSYKELQGKSEQQQTYWSLQGCSVLNLMYKYNTIYQSSPTIKRKLYGSK